MTDAADVFAAFRSEVVAQTPLRSAITAAYRVPEPQCVPPLLELATANADEAKRIRTHRPQPGWQAERQDALKRRRRPHPRIFAVEPGGRGADVPRRGSFAHSRRRDARRADPRQARARRLARACRHEPVAVRQRRHLGSGADRPARDDDQRAGPVGRADPPHRAQRRADHSRWRRRRHAAHGRAVRNGAHDRGGDRKQPRARGARIHFLVRHAGRSGDHGRGCGALSRRIRARRPRHRPRLASSRHLRRARNLNQAFGAPPALSAHQARPRDERTVAAGQGARGPRQIL